MFAEDDEDFFLIEDGDSAAEVEEAKPKKRRLSLGKSQTKPDKSTSSDDVVPSKSKSLIKGLARNLVSEVAAATDAVKDRLKPKDEAPAKPEDEVQPSIEEAPAEKQPTKQLEGEDDDDMESVVAGIHRMSWPILGMDCPDCAMRATQAVNRLPGVDSVVVSATSGTVEFDMDLAAGNISRVSNVLSSLGHEPDLPWQEVVGVTASGLASDHSVSRSDVRKKFLKVPGVLAVRFEDASVRLLTLPYPSPVIRDELSSGLTRVVGRSPNLRILAQDRLNSGQWRLVLTIPAIVILFVVILFGNKLPQSALFSLTAMAVGLSGWKMFSEAIAGLRNRQMVFQLLTSLAVAGAFFGGHWSEALTVCLLVAIASHMEDAALRRARDGMQGGLDRLPRRARLASAAQVVGSISVTDSPSAFSLNSNAPGHTDDDMIPIDLVNIGDKVEIRSGELVPIDGLVVEGIGSLNRAPLTGESIPIRVDEGMTVHAGLVLDRGPIIVEVTAVSEGTRLHGLIEEVRTFREKPPRMQKTIEAFTNVWVPLVVVGAVLAGLFFTPDGTGFNLRLMLLLWVVACPCALLLAAPVPNAAALSVAAKSGIIARGGDALDAASRIDLALLDKTGTLTSGRPKLDQITTQGRIDRTRSLRIAGGLEIRSNHPYASVIQAQLEEEGLKPSPVTGITDGRAGVIGSLRGKTVMFGRADWLKGEGVKIDAELSDALAVADTAGNGASLLAVGGQAIALFTFIHDDLRDGSAEMVHDLRNLGIAVELLSGDSQSAVEDLGRQIGVAADNCRGEIDPEGKAIWVERRSQGRRTLMAGDGFNDAAALAAADVGIAVGSGEQVNLEAADVLIPGEDPRSITTLLKLSRRTRTVIQANILLSVIVTLTLVVLVLLGIQTDLAVGVAIHEASAFLVILNGAFVAISGNRFSLVGEVMMDLVRDYRDAFLLLFRKSSSSV